MASFGGCQPREEAAESAAAEYELAADWSLADADGRIVTLSDEILQGPRLVLFWATWCPYCRALMPHIQSIVMEYGGAIAVLAVNIREDGDPAAYLAKSGFDFRLLPEGEKVAELYDVKSTPGLFLVDTNGNIRFDATRLPALPLSQDGEKLPHRIAAQRRAPYWAAELRKALDQTLDES